ncbi:MAG: type I restriction enzyme HsdR N-terminal domain-containing protein [Chitinophagaceae bacterium]|nr:MAG: type I restriction enzyme HsdR N-terminal domain-containing protein [Chitinophagaceae bacterium]
MIKITYPDKKPSIRQSGEKEQVFCIARKRWVSLTPEEWVRQNTLLYMVESLQYPLALIAVERPVKLGELQKRFDIVVYKNTTAFLLIECKEMNVPITQKTLDQVMRYNINLQAVYFVITNGTACFGFSSNAGQLQALDKFPVF